MRPNSSFLVTQRRQWEHFHKRPKTVCYSSPQDNIVNQDSAFSQCDTTLSFGGLDHKTLAKPRSKTDRHYKIPSHELAKVFSKNFPTPSHIEEPSVDLIQELNPTITASSVYKTEPQDFQKAAYGPKKAIDSIYGIDFTNEWANGKLGNEGVGEFIEIRFPKEVYVDFVEVYDRASLVEDSTEIKLEYFSDLTWVVLKAKIKDFSGKSATDIKIEEHNVSKIRLTITGIGDTTNYAGIGEVFIYGRH